MDEYGREGAKAEGDRTEKDDFFTADTISDGTQDESADHQAEEAGTEDRSKRSAAQLPFAGDLGSNIPDRLGVKAIDE